MQGEGDEDPNGSAFNPEDTSVKVIVQNVRSGDSVIDVFWLDTRDPHKVKEVMVDTMKSGDRKIQSTFPQHSFLFRLHSTGLWGGIYGIHAISSAMICRRGAGDV